MANKSKNIEDLLENVINSSDIDVKSAKKNLHRIYNLHGKSLELQQQALDAVIEQNLILANGIHKCLEQIKNLKGEIVTIRGELTNTRSRNQLL